MKVQINYYIKLFKEPFSLLSPASIGFWLIAVFFSVSIQASQEEPSPPNSANKTSIGTKRNIPDVVIDCSDIKKTKRTQKNLDNAVLVQKKRPAFCLCEVEGLAGILS